MPAVGPLQIVLVGFETTERFRGDIARELANLRGRGMIRVVDARLFHRAADGALTEVDLNPLLEDARRPVGNPIAHLLGANGAGNGAHPLEGLGGTVGFAIEDLRRLTDEIGPGDHAAVVLVEHLWAGRLRETVHEAGGRLLGQGFLTPEVVMIVGAEIQARTEAEAAIELADAARGAAIIEALETFATRGGMDASIEERTRAAAKIVHALVDKGFMHESEAAGALDALTTEGLVERAVVDAVLADAEDILGGDDGPLTE
jgi:hypothetical protein